MSRDKPHAIREHGIAVRDPKRQRGFPPSLTFRVRMRRHTTYVDRCNFLERSFVRSVDTGAFYCSQRPLRDFSGLAVLEVHHENGDVRGSDAADSACLPECFGINTAQFFTSLMT